MKCIKTRDDVKQLGTILGIWAHPDDETVCCGGLMAAARANGQRVVCLTATKGEAGVQDEARWPRTKLGAIREAELKAALQIFGVYEHYWLGCRDGCCGELSDTSGAEQVSVYLKKIQPDTILTFPPNGLTGHPDHQAVSRWVRRAVEASNSSATIYCAATSKEQYDAFLKTADEKMNIYFALDSPELVPAGSCDILFELDADLRRRKIQALHALPSQYDSMFAQFGEKWALDAFAQEAFVKAQH
jgi:LmbE family N-acetylglucosaminyl deacetylase